MNAWTTILGVTLAIAGTILAMQGHPWLAVLAFLSIPLPDAAARTCRKAKAELDRQVKA